jgi:D-glycero-alpha-D-manno-heptose 1-phosphate guanylyltransferase
MEAIILAGGLGTRLRSAVPDLPKPLAPIKGKPFLDYLINYWQGQGIKRFNLSVGYKHEAIRDYFGSKYKSAEVTYTVEKEPLGTGGGLLLAMKRLKYDEPFLLLNGDTFFAINRSDLVKHHSECGSEMTLSLTQVPRNDRYDGVLLNKHGWINSLEARTEDSKSSIINGGVYIIERKLLSAYEARTPEKCSFEDELLPELLSQKRRISGYLSRGIFIDIGIPQDYNRAAEVLSRHGSIL